MATRIFAAIDVGSFEVEMTIYEISGKNVLRQIDQLRHVIALGRDTYNTGKISYELVDEMCRVLGEFAKVMKSYQVDDYRAVATSAMREAGNSHIILDQIRVRTGIEVRIISNSEQRFLSYKAIAMKEAEFQKIIQKGTAIADVSFGSMQLSLFDKDSLVSTLNIRLGVLRLRGVLARVQADARTEQSLVEEMVENELYTFKKLYLKDREIKNLIGIGESILYLIRDSSGVRRGDRISAEDFLHFYNRLISMSLDQIEEAFSVNADYARLMVPSAVIYKQVLEMTGAEMLWIPGIRLCDGIAADYAESIKYLKFTHNFDDDILTASRNMSKRYRCNSGHIQQVEEHALQIFDAMKKYHGLGARERLLLRIAAVLHDCGKFISMRDSSQCAYHIIMSTEIIGLSHKERELIANVVRCNLENFDYNNDILTAKMTAMLRLANAMDRSHHKRLAGCRLTVKDRQLAIAAPAPENLALELLAIEGKADFFEEIFGIRPVLKQKRRF